MKLKLQKVGDLEVDGVEALGFETRWTYPLGLVQQYQVLVSSGTHLLLFTFFGPPEVFDSYRPVFDETLASVRLASGRHPWGWAAPVAISAGAGAAVGAALAVGIGLFINRRRLRRARKTALEASGAD